MRAAGLESIALNLLCGRDAVCCSERGMVSLTHFLQTECRFSLSVFDLPSRDNLVPSTIAYFMKKELLMKGIIAVFVLFAAATVVPVTPASAQETLRAAVPFAFTVGSRLLPVGNYRITPWKTSSGTNGVLIESEERSVSQLAMADPSYNFGRGKTKLAFDKVGNQYFLKEVFSTSVTMALPMSDSEKKARTSQGRPSSDTKTVVP
jgi:hypothetical protein